MASVLAETTGEGGPVTNPAYLASRIPIDLFISKKHPGLAPGTIGFADATGNIVCTVQPHSPQSNKTHFFSLHIRNFTLLDADGHPLMTLTRKENGCWQSYKSTTNKDLIFSSDKEVIKGWRENPDRSFHPRTKWPAGEFKFNFNNPSLDFERQSISEIMHHL